MGFLSLIAKLGLDISGYETGLKRAESSVSKFSRNTNSMLKSQIAGAIGTGAIIAASKAAIDYASHINDLSTRIGVGTEKLQEYAYAAKQTGGSIDDFANVARKLAQSRAEALKNPTGDAAAGFAKLGIAANELKTIGIDGLIDKIGIAFKNARNPQDLLAAGFSTMGRGALPVIGAMREGLAELGQEARDSFAVMSDDTITKLDDIGDAMDRLKTSMISGLGEGLATLLGGVKEAWRFVKGTTANAAAYLGARSGGASRLEAANMGDEAQAAEAAKDAAEDMAFGQKRQRRRRDAAALTGDFSEETRLGNTTSASSSFIKASTNNLQQIGAFSGVDPVVRELQTSNATQKRTEANTKRIAEKSIQSGVEHY